jgi:hypothetical protein
MADPKNGNPILDLDALVSGASIRIAGTDYPLVTPTRLPPLDGHRFGRYASRIDDLSTKTDLTEAEETELAALPDRMCRLVLRAPSEVHQALDDVQRMAIVEAFMTVPPTARTVGATTASPGHPSTGASPSPGSAVSTDSTP